MGVRNRHGDRVTIVGADVLDVVEVVGVREGGEEEEGKPTNHVPLPLIKFHIRHINISAMTLSFNDLGFVVIHPNSNDPIFSFALSTGPTLVW